ncbi:hypothetical protein J416_14412 [Gracilibacillus halophilus YIM-C55.5]|uniref:LrgA family protein n=1 Tax=Gracilibacillus halophilus YIM-C55.5 TaxID=1308866 RepID=N4W948_9BACI|nr:hypothetical protein J416_14412 [Gracilibacillus halophilus YIM-C55.5]
MPIFFIPVTIGVIEYLHFFAGKGSLMIPIVMISTICVILFTGIITDYYLKKEAQQHD